MEWHSLKVRSGTNAQLIFFAEDTICRLIINVKPEPKLIKDLLKIASTSSPDIANTFVVSSPSYADWFLSRNQFTFNVYL
jgi:hypothetical protein